MPITSALSMLLEIAQRKCATQIHAYILTYLMSHATFTLKRRIGTCASVFVIIVCQTASVKL